MICSILISFVFAQALPSTPAPTKSPKPTPSFSNDAVAPSRPTVGFRGPPIAVTYETQVVEAPGPTVSMAFGNVLAFSGDRLVISGAVISRRIGADGQIFTFELKNNTWTSVSEMVQVQGLAPDEVAIQRILADPEFLLTNISRKGKSSEIISFAPTEGREAWKQSGSIKPPPNETVLNFSSAMALSDTLLAVSEVSVRPNQKDEDFPKNPRVFIFQRTVEGWKAQGVIQRDARYEPWWFGISLAMDGDTLAVGNPKALIPFTTEKIRSSLAPAMVCIYRRTPEGWKLEQEINNSGLSPWHGFGMNIALKGDLLVVRSMNPYDREAEVDVGVLRRVNGQWILEGSLTPAQGVMKSKAYGYALAIDHDRIIVSDAMTVEGSDSNGRVYVFEKTDKGWQEEWRLAPKVFVSPNSFGNTIAFHWPWLAVGRTRSERLGIEPGGALLYKLEERAPQQDGSAAGTQSDPK